MELSNYTDTLQHALGFLVGQMGISEGLATLIISVLAGSGAAVVVAAWPFLAPIVVTLRGIFAVAGTAAAVGW
ncbi:hypothetical protein D0U04_19510 [Bacillus clarus]|uniref:Putative membrane protein n=1 Tax=Bacillus clarus TaxID=2338372 RepID=A0A090YZ12_9BACI|nr:hypothetical protein [Bacillus clarus]KFN03567.1 putative membrane protein [Bacillus clarus]RFT65437.1 hypothetical protein D0U04_19510 [Bacillus clarus]